ncbi:MAG: hypothetical protein WKF35_02005 [Ferruginibacter sp.]
METEKFTEAIFINEKENAKNCIACNKTLRGRTDKKFCNEYCRNNFNNRLKSDTNNQVRNINHALGKNRRILEKLLKEEKSHKVSATELLQNGFHFKYFTHQYINKKGVVYLFCYDFGYLPLKNDNYLLVNPVKNRI